YIKSVDRDEKNAYAIIPGVSLSKDPSKSHAFVMLFDARNHRMYYFKYPLSEFSASEDTFDIRIGKSHFGLFDVSLDIDDGRNKVSGELRFTDIHPWPVTLLSPGVMGWYAFVPRMECYHGVLSFDHDIDGGISINSMAVDFSGGKGYIEKDWGTSFPECWIWIQANNFHDHSTSFSFSVAKIPWRGHFFMGFITYLYYHGRFYLFSTYNNSSIKELSHTGDSVFISIANKTNSLRIKSTKNRTGVLKAPVEGRMSGTIRESIDSDVSIVLYDKDDRPVYTDASRRAGIEVVDKIFEYFT
ncbi:MAG TPA: tocopherol cyclase family protein, partial [Bacteroidales bacterium]|nr:tocopherol cyclase family protein [Bacteroidales bacterium]